MLPLIIGGVTLATIGYGVKKYFDEEGYPWSNTHENNDESCENIYKQLKQLNSTRYNIQSILLQESAVFLEELKNLPVQENIEEINGVYYFEMNNDNIAMLEKFNSTLLNAQNLLNDYLDAFETFVFSSSDYEKLIDEEKTKLDKTIVLNSAIKEACLVALSLDGKTVSKMAKRCFKKLEILTENKE